MGGSDCLSWMKAPWSMNVRYGAGALQLSRLAFPVATETRAIGLTVGCLQGEPVTHQKHSSSMRRMRLYRKWYPYCHTKLVNDIIGSLPDAAFTLPSSPPSCLEKSSSATEPHLASIIHRCKLCGSPKSDLSPNNYQCSCPSPTPGGNSPFLTDVELDDRSSWNRPGSRNSMYEYNSLRPFSRQSVGSAASCHS